MNLKTLLKRNHSIVAAYDALQFLKQIPLADLRYLRKLQLVFAIKPYSYMNYANLSKLYDLAAALESSGLEGSTVECGVLNGGSAALLAAVARRAGSARPMWLFDSFEGLPEPDEMDVNYLGKPGHKGQALGQVEKVEEVLYKKLKLRPEAIHIQKGWFEDTVPRARQAIGRIALLHVDCDWYRSVKYCLEHLYDLVVPGGYVVIDDYGHWLGCRKAVDEFLAPRGVSLTRIDYTGVYARKS